MQEIKITINRQILSEYNQYYFQKYPRRKKIPIDKPIPPSLNTWMIMRRPQMNNVKQQWKEFGVWLVQYNNLQDKKIPKCKIDIEYFFDSKRRHDADNFTPKNLFDSFTVSGLLVDDDFDHVESLTIRGIYSKDNPRTEITFIYEEGDETND